MTPKPNILVIVATEAEELGLVAALRTLGQASFEPIEKGKACWATLRDSCEYYPKISILIARGTEMGGAFAASITALLLKYYDPDVIAMTGACAADSKFEGSSKIRRGDLIVPVNIQYAARLKQQPDGGKERGSWHAVANGADEGSLRTLCRSHFPLFTSKYKPQLRDRFPNLTGDEEEDITEVRLNSFTIHTDLDLQTVDGIKIADDYFALVMADGQRGVHALDMEAFYVARIAREFNKPFYLVKGVQDFATPNTRASQKDIFKDYIAFTSALFLIDLIVASRLLKQNAEPEMRDVVEVFRDPQAKRITCHKVLSETPLTVAVAGYNKTLTVIASGSVPRQMTTQDSIVRCLDYDGSRNLLLSGNDSGQIVVQSIDRNLQSRFTAHQGPIYSIALNTQLHLLATVGKDGFIRLFPTDNISLGFSPEILPVETRAIAELQTGSRPLFSVIWAHIGADEVVMAAGQAGELWIYRIASQTITKTKLSDFTIFCLSYISEKKMLLCGNSQGEVITTSVPDNADASQCSAPVAKSYHENGVRNITFSPTQRLIATCGRDSVVHVRSIDNDRTVFHKFHNDYVYAVTFTDRPRQVISVGGDGRCLSCPLDGAFPVTYDA